MTGINLAYLERRARRGRMVDVDFLMEQLHPNQEFGLCKMIDYALGLIESDTGRERIRHYLFNGRCQMQRNYAALYFKRRHVGPLLDEAVERGCIDIIQAYAQ